MKTPNIFRIKDFSKTIILINAVVIFTAIYSYKMWRGDNRVITWDVTSYYSYLPATFIFKDPQLKFINENREFYLDKFVPLKSPTGGNVIKMSMGLSIVYSPFFFLAHLVAKITHFQADGFSEPYRLALILSSFLFNIFGLIWLRKLLLNYFTKIAVIWTLCAVAMGTNLLYYTAVRSAMSHSYNFALINLFILLVINWYKKQHFLNSIFLGLTGGLIVLIRPTNAVIALFFIFLGINSFNDMKSRISLIFQKFHLILIILIFSIIVWIPQLLYWKATTGQYLFFSYQGESFFFNNPQIIKGFFSYRNGWLLYTPIMIFSFFGFLQLYKNKNGLFWPVLLTFSVFIYLVLSWWCWWYVGFGNRAFIDIYGLLAIALAAFIEWISKLKTIFHYVFIPIFIFLILLNIFQCWQYKMGYIQFDSMSKKAYWSVFGSFNPHDRFWKYLKYPDYDKAIQGIYVDKQIDKQ